MSFGYREKSKKGLPRSENQKKPYSLRDRKLKVGWWADAKTGGERIESKYCFDENRQLENKILLEVIKILEE